MQVRPRVDSDGGCKPYMSGASTARCTSKHIELVRQCTMHQNVGFQLVKVKYKSLATNRGTRSAVASLENQQRHLVQYSFGINFLKSYSSRNIGELGNPTLDSAIL
jgi:hypothetical protein